MITIIIEIITALILGAVVFQMGFNRGYDCGRRDTENLHSERITRQRRQRI